MHTIDVHKNAERSIEEILEQCAALLERMDEMLLGFEPMSLEETRQAAKLPRAGGEAVVDELAAQCEAIDFTQADRYTTVEGMLEALQRSRILRDVIERQEAVSARLKGARMRAESESWRAALTFYAVLRRTAVREPQVRERLETVKAYFQARGRGRRRDAHRSS